MPARTLATPPPQKDQSPGAWRHDGGLGGQAQAVELDSAARAAVEQADKRVATLRAELALRGHELHIIGDGQGGAAYLVAMGALTRVLPDLAAVGAFAERVGVEA